MFKKWTNKSLIEIIDRFEAQILKENEVKHIAKDFYIVVQGKVKFTRAQ